jgi:chitinase
MPTAPPNRETRRSHGRRGVALAVTTTTLLLALSATGAPPGEKPGPGPAGKPGRDFVVVGYVPDYRLASFDPAVGGLVTDLIFFSIQPKPTGELDAGRLTDKGLAKLAEARKRHKNRLLVAVGGWGRSRGFAGVATDEKARQLFVSNLTKFCLDNKLDGADFDWEHPANKAEEKAYATLLVDVKRAFRPKELLVTVALADWQDPGATAYDAVDRIHIMAYDHGGERHSTLEQAKADVKKFLDRGVAKEKLCLGLPFYGRSMKDRKVEMSYADIVKKHKPTPDADEAGGVYFNGTDTIRKKVRYAQEAGLGGVMVWELGQDMSGAGSLLETIHEAVTK